MSDVFHVVNNFNKTTFIYLYYIALFSKLLPGHHFLSKFQYKGMELEFSPVNLNAHLPALYIIWFEVGTCHRYVSLYSAAGQLVELMSVTSDCIGPWFYLYVQLLVLFLVGVDNRMHESILFYACFKNLQYDVTQWISKTFYPWANWHEF